MQPRFLQQGDRIIIVSPSGKVNKGDVERAITIFQSWGLEVDCSPHALGQDNQFSGTDHERIQDLQEAFDNPDYKAVVCARGGYGLTRIIDALDLTSFTMHPKWVVGYSDITALHYRLSKEGYESIHGIMPSQMGKPGSEDAVESLRNLLFGQQGSVVLESSSEYNRDGQGSGQLIGGNLSLIENMIGTKTFVSSAQKILFIEDVGEYLYRLDRMLVHLERAGLFQDLSGLVVGGFTDMKDSPTPFGSQPYDMIAEITQKYQYPVLFDVPVGHSLHNIALPVGRKLKLEVELKNGRLTE